MALINQRVYYKDDEFSVLIWDAAKAGDINKPDYPQPQTREQFPCLSVTTRGSFEITKPSGKFGWIIKSGESSLEKEEYWDEAGIYTNTALEDNSQEICIAAYTGRVMVLDPYRSLWTMKKNESVQLKRSCVMFVITGEIDTPKGLISAPHFVRVRNPVTIKATKKSKLALISHS